MDGVSALTLILVLSFAIERIATGSTLLWSWWTDKLSPEKEKRLAYFLCAVPLGLGARHFGGIGILAALSVPGFAALNSQAFVILDYIVTAIVLAGGANQLSALQERIGEVKEEEEPAPQPIEISGTLTLDKEASMALAKAATLSGN